MNSAGKKLTEVIDEQIIATSNDWEKAIKEVTSVFSDNCFNCLNWENLPWADYTKLTRCETTWITNWLKNSSWTPACENYEPTYNH